MTKLTTDRRRFLAGSAALFVGLAADGVRSAALAADEPAPAHFTELRDWLRMLPDGTVELYTDKVEMGMGLATGFAQFVADELDVPLARVRPMLGDTATTVNTAGVGGSFSTFAGNFAIRHAAAEMRRVLLAAAATRLGVPAAQLTVHDGVVSAGSGRTVRYVELLPALAADTTKYQLRGDAFSTDIAGTATPKAWTAYRLAGSPVPRLDAAAKAFGRYPYVVDVKLPGMLHGRFAYPPAVGATVVSVDPASIAGIGDARIVRDGSFVGVVASREWDAVRALERLSIAWSAPSTTFPAQDRLADYMWAQKPFKDETVANGDVKAALGAAPISAEYQWPFQSHANMGPGCTVADVRPDGVTIWSGTQKTHSLALGMSRLLKRPVSDVRVIWVSDCGSYGRGGLEESAAAAVLLSRAVGKPVRVQSMRSDNTQWGNKAPAMVARMRGTTAGGAIVAFDAQIRQFNGNEILSSPIVAGDFVASQLTGLPNDAGTFEFGQYGSASGRYTIPNLRATAELIAPFAPVLSPLRTAHMRDPEGPATTFIIESFIDELAAHAQADPIAFRIKHLSEPRYVEALQAVARAAGWQARPAATAPRTGAGGELLGRGVAFATRGPTIVATVAEVGVDRATGAVRVHRLICAQDCGFVVNPKSLQGTIEANLVQSMSRAIFEEATWNDRTVTSVDWRTYPVAGTNDIPAEVTVVMIDRQTLPPGGAGEPSTRPTAAAIGNAIFDATGVRVRTAPFNRRNVLAALGAARTG